jgi:AraC-like DNA-binding protein
MATDEVDLKPKRFSTDELPERERLSRWREEFGRTIVNVDIEPLSSDLPFRAEATLQSLPGAGMACCEGAAVRLHRTRALAADGDDSIGLIVNTGPSALASQRGADVTLGEGDAVFVLTDEPGVLNGTSHLSFVFPRTALAQRLHTIDSVVMRSIPRSNESLRLFLRYIRLIHGEVGSAAPALQETITSHIHDLVALAIGASREAREQGKGAIAATRLAAAIDYIGKHFADPALTLSRVAYQQRISPRYLQELLEQSGASFVARVNELRLKRAFVLLTRFPERPVSEVAASAGFSNISHFNRLFRQRFGDSPSGVRSRS